jgi:hypothetical protein
MKDKIIENIERVREMRFALIKESDRGACLLSVSFLEVELENLLRAYLLHDKKVWNKIFNGHGSLATFSSKIDMCYLLGIITNEIHKDLDIIRKIRNDFAHSHLKINFEDNKFKNRCDNLKLNYRHKTDKTRDRFITTVCGLIGKIIAIGLTIERVKENSEDISDSLGINEPTEDFVIKMKKKYYDYKEMLETLYTDFPNKDNLVKNELLEYIDDLKNAQLKSVQELAIFHESKMKNKIEDK